MSGLRPGPILRLVFAHQALATDHPRDPGGPGGLGAVTEGGPGVHQGLVGHLPAIDEILHPAAVKVNPNTDGGPAQQPIVR